MSNARWSKHGTRMSLERFLGFDIPGLKIAHFKCKVSGEYTGSIIFKASYILPNAADVFLSKDLGLHTRYSSSFCGRKTGLS